MTKKRLGSQLRELFEVKYDSLAHLKTYVLRIVLLSGVVGISLIWLNESFFHVLRPMDFVAYPIFASVFLILAGLLSWRRRYYQIVIVLTFLIFIIYIVMYAFYTIQIEQKQARIYSVSTYLQLISLMYITAFVFFIRMRSLILTFAGLISLSTMMIFYAVLNMPNANDALSKSFLINNFVFHALQVAILLVSSRITEQFTKVEAQTEVLKQMASVDYLTGTANRRHIENIIAHSFSSSPDDLAIVMLDIDHFKQINDTHGHDVGDQALICVSRRLREHMRSSDTLGRWGGEEFVVVAPNTDLEQAARLAERLRLVLLENSSQEFALTASFGVAVYRHDDTPDSLVKRADQALYRAKDRGRNCVELAE